MGRQPSTSTPESARTRAWALRPPGPEGRVSEGRPLPAPGTSASLPVQGWQGRQAWPSQDPPGDTDSWKGRSSPPSALTGPPLLTGTSSLWPLCLRNGLKSPADWRKAFSPPGGRADATCLLQVCSSPALRTLPSPTARPLPVCTWGNWGSFSRQWLSQECKPPCIQDRFPERTPQGWAPGALLGRSLVLRSSPGTGRPQEQGVCVSAPAVLWRATEQACVAGEAAPAGRGRDGSPGSRLPWQRAGRRIKIQF